MARSTYYYQLARIDKPDKYTDLCSRITEIFLKNHGNYGYRRITLALNREGIQVNHKTVYRLMKKMGLHARIRRQKYHSYKGEIGKVAPDCLKRDFHTELPDRKWTTDITQMNIKGQKLYLSPILDMFNGEIISFSISEHPDMKMVMSMLEKAFREHPDLEGLIFHSDQGGQYQSPVYQRALSDRGIQQSMSRKGNCLDNSMMESFFGTMKNELLYTREWDNADQFRWQLIKYIRYYNNSRIKLRLNGMSPIEYRISVMTG